MPLSLRFATHDDADAIADLRNIVAEDLIRKYGPGHWGFMTTGKSVASGISPTSKVLVATKGGKLIGTLRLAKKKPWAIDPAYFTPVKFPIYLLDMCIRPSTQRKGHGDKMIKKALEVAKSWPSDSIRLDAYDTEAGAGEFYRKCGFRERGRVVYRKTPLIYYEWVLVK